MSRRYAVLIFLLLLPLVNSVQAVGNDHSGMTLYTFDDTLPSVSVTLNLTSSVEYNLAIVSTSNYQKLLQGVRSPLQLQSYYFIQAHSENKGDDSISYSGDLHGLYLLVYSPDVLFNQSNEGTYTLSGSNFQKTSLSQFGERTFEYMHGNEKTVSDNVTTRYTVYSLTALANKPTEFYISSSDSDIMMFVDDNRSKIDASFVSNLVGNYSNMMNGSVPDTIADFAFFTGEGGYMGYNSSKTTKLQVIVYLTNSYSGDGKTYIYFASSEKSNHDSSAAWYSAWFIDLAKGSSITHPPAAAFFLVVISIFTSLLSAFVTRKLVNLEELNKYQKQISKHNKLKNKARETADKQLWTRVQARDKRISGLQQKIMMKRMLPQLFLSLPFIAIFTTLRGVMGDKYLNLIPDRGGIVAVLPFQFPEWIFFIGGWFSRYVSIPEISAAGFGFMYFLSAIISSTLIQRIFGINLQGARPENPFQR